MSHSYYNVWLHLIFGTKYRQNLITKKYEAAIHNRIRDILNEQGCKVKAINGVADHIHVLLSMNPNKSIAQVVKAAKGASSNWINKNQLTEQKFSWQTGYSVFSVSEFHIPTIVKYIKKQKEHHAKTHDLNRGKKSE